MQYFRLLIDLKADRPINRDVYAPKRMGMKHVLKYGDWFTVWGEIVNDKTDIRPEHISEKQLCAHSETVSGLFKRTDYMVIVPK